MNHFQFSRPKGTEIPLNVFVLHAQAEYSQVPGDERTFEGKLRCFHSLAFRMEKDVPTRQSECIDDEAESFWNHLQSKSAKDSCVWIFGFDLARHLTLLGFWQLLEQKRFTVEPRYASKPGKDGKRKTTWTGKMVLENRPFFIVCRGTTCTYKFVDIQNYWPNGLQSIAADHSIPFIPQPDEFSTADEWRIANTNRVEIVATAVQSLIVKWRHECCGAFQMTAPMLAMASWKAKCSVRNLKNDKVDVVFTPGHKSHEMERDAYFGGRTQCFFVGEKRERVYHVDCNSLFPFVMHRDYYPRRFVRYAENESVATVRDSFAAYGIVARIKVDSDKFDFPVRIDGLQYHVTGTYVATLAGSELARAVHSGAARQIFAAQYYSLAPLFRTWVNYWFDRKVAGTTDGRTDRSETEFAKMILNSLYGKFAQRSMQWRDVPGVVPMRKWGGWPQYDVKRKQYTKWRGVGGHTQMLVEGKEPKHSFPAISAFITANAREYMRSVFGIVGENNLLYSATDSLIITQVGFERMEAAGLIHATELGKFKVKGSYDYARIFGANDYQLGGTRTVAGYLGASLSQGGDGHTATIKSGVSEIIAADPSNSVKHRLICVPSTRADYRGKIDGAGRWHPYSIQDPLIMSGQLAALADRRGYSAGMGANHIALLSDV